MAKRKPTKTQQLRKLVQQQVRRMESRGYRIDDAVKEKIKSGKYQTLQSLRKNRYEKLYSSASAEIDSKIVSGQQKRKYERSETARKAARTRRVRRDIPVEWKTADKDKLIDELYGSHEAYEKKKKTKTRDDLIRATFGSEENYQEWKKTLPEEPEDAEPYETTQGEPEEDTYDYLDTYFDTTSEEELWRQERIRQDRQDRVNAEMFSEGEAIYSNFLNMIDLFPTPGAKYLNNLLKSEVNQFGEDAVINSLALIDSDIIEDAQSAIYDSDGSGSASDRVHKNLQTLADAIKGTIMNTMESKEIGAVLDSMTDFEAF